MAETTLRIDTPDGPMTTLLLDPGDGAAHPLVVVYMAATGIDAGLRAFAGQIAEQGYTVAVPDAYHRDGELLTFDPADPEARERMMTLARALTDDMVVADTAALLAALDDEPLVAPGPAGAIGFCMGGRHAVRATAANPDRIVATSGLHPTALVGEGPGSPHLGVSGVRGEVYLGLGSEDQVSPPSSNDAMVEALEQAGATVHTEVHLGADHGYMFPGPRHDPEGAQRSLAATLELLRRNLAQPAAVPR
jgi:carboxymethylenebutenolidase